MSAAPLHAAVRHLRRLVRPDGADGLSDGQLLERFVAAQDEAAFEVLVWRHGPLVLGICRRVLRDPHLAEDAFQATFLVLVRKAASICKREAVGSWLHKVAYRVALGAREGAARRGRHERPLLADAPAAEEAAGYRDMAPVLDEEVNRLPDKYRAPLVLCYLEGKTVDEAARQLGCPRGTVGTRLARGRERLRRRLIRRGVGLTCGALAAALAGVAHAVAVPAPLARAAVRTACFPADPGIISAKVIALAEGVLHTMSVSKLKAVVAIVLAIALGTGVSGLSYRMYASEQGPAADEGQQKAGSPGERVPSKTWGTETDPDKDCKFTYAKGKLTITVPGKDHDLGAERQVMNAPRVLRPVEGDFTVQVKVSGKFKPEDADTDERAAFQGAGLLVLDDDNNYVRLERASYIRGDDTHHYTNWELRKDGEVERFGSPDDQPLEDGKDTWLRIERHGDKVSAAISQDGEKWTDLEAKDASFPKKVQVGVAAVNTSKQEFAPQFSEFKLSREAKK
jgi:RNA polymerase sigma factor (sigma-70 family)